MKNRPITFLLTFLILLLVACSPAENRQETAETGAAEETTAADPARQLVMDMIAACGGLDRYGALRDVEYTYTYRRATGEQDVSIERYLYDGELSWAEYTERGLLFPGLDGTLIQGYDGDTTWVTLDGERLTDPQVIRRADFQRKTNYYWLNMMYKLADPGVRYELEEDRSVNGVNYQVVKITFGEDVGDAQDIYVLYIHPETRLVDRFLFTVMDYGRAEPLLMEVRYEEAGGLKWPAYRRYAPADWEGNLAEDAGWTEEISENIQVDNGFEPSLFKY